MDSTLQQQESKEAQAILYSSYKLTKEEWNTIEDRRFEYEKNKQKEHTKRLDCQRGKGE